MDPISRLGGTGNASGANSSAKIWKLGHSLLRASSSRGESRPGAKTERAPSTPPPAESPSSAAPQVPVVVVAASSDSNARQLRELAQRMRAAPQNPVHVDIAWREFSRVREQCAGLVRALLSPPTPAPGHNDPGWGLGSPEGRKKRRSSATRPRKAASAYAKIGVVPWRLGSSESLSDGGGLAPVPASAPAPPAAGPSRAGKRASVGGAAPLGRGDRPRNRVGATSLAAIRDWRDCLEALAEQHRASLESDPWPDIGDALEGGKKFRVQVAVRSKSEARLRNYEAVKRELAEVGSLLQAGESGISLDRVIVEHAIAPRGDTVLEFANTDMAWEPVLRFRVSSHMLAETSPLFARMFLPADHLAHLDLDAMDADVPDADLPPPPVPFVGEDGLPAKLYRMPQLEPDREAAFSLLLHAAHHHNDVVPRDIAFPQFVAVAEACLRYKCTAPLEVYVEHRWLPQWMHKATEEMPDGLLLICYAFGVRRLFTRMTKTVIMNIVSEKEIYDKSWPKPIKDRIRAICSAKRAQIHDACRAAVDEYLRPPPTPRRDPLVLPGLGLTEHDPSASSSGPGDATPDLSKRESWASTASTARPTPAARPLSTSTTITAPASAPPAPTGAANPFFAAPPAAGRLLLSSTPRCPKGSHWCDATNLGWLLLVLNELQALGTVFRASSSAALAAHPEAAAAPPPRSLAQLVSSLSTVPSPPHPVHAGQRMGGVCDPAPAFRSAVNDIYNSVSGLTLFDIAGRHGWGLSRHKRDSPQVVLRLRLRGRRFALPEGVCLRILEAVAAVDDLRCLARVNRGFWETYLRFEGRLVGRLLGVVAGGGEADGEGKVLRGERDGLLAARGRGPGGYIGEEDEEDEDEEEDEYDSSDMDDDDDADDAETDVETDADAQTEAPGQGQAADGTAPMTDEEARRIIWPDPEPEPGPRPAATANRPRPPRARAMSESWAGPSRGVPGISERLRAGSSDFVEGKTLLMAEGKQLRAERDRMTGLFPRGQASSPSPPERRWEEDQGWI